MMLETAASNSRNDSGSPTLSGDTGCSVRATRWSVLSIAVLCAWLPRPGWCEDRWVTLDRAALEVVARWWIPRAPIVEWAVEGEISLIQVPEEAFPELSERMHEELGRCGGLVVHPDRAAALEELDRLRLGARAPETALPFVLDQPGWVSILQAQVSAPSILATIESLSTQFVNRYHAHPSGTDSAQWIKQQWELLAAGRPGVTVELYSHPSNATPQPSVILTWTGRTHPQEIVVIGGHQDSTRSGCNIASNPSCAAPGADDDASGIATVTEALRVLLGSGFRPQRTIQAMAYAAEEVGLRGSNDIATNYANAQVNVVGVLQLDMTGFRGSAEDVLLMSDHTDPELTSFVGDLIAVYQPSLLVGTTQCGYACSDHARWHAMGYRAAFPFEARMGQHNAALHTLNDTVATLGNSGAHAAKFARLAVAFLVEAAADGPEELLVDDFESGNTIYWSSTQP